MHAPEPPALPPLPAIPGRGPVLAGFSGGLDSTVLLHLLAGDPRARARGLRALHVDHGLHQESAGWAAHCVAVGAGLGIEVDVVRVVVDAAGLGREGAARDARMAAFAAALADGGVLALAHHRDDQAETLLLRALRGSGVDALGAMHALRLFARGTLWRPLLALPRSALHAHALAHGLHWIDDPANGDTDLDRNYLRHRVLPLLRARWPQADAALARSAALAREGGSLLDAGDADALAQVQGLDPRTLSAPRLAAWPAPRQARVLRRWIAALGLPPLPGRGVDWALHAAGDAGAGRFAWSGAVLTRWRDLLHADRARPPLPPGFDARWDGRDALALGDGDALSLTGGPPAGFGGWQVRARRGGERITLPGRSHSHALKHVLQDLGVPPWERARLPLLFAADGALDAAGDLVLSARFDHWLRAHGLGIGWRRGP